MADASPPPGDVPTPEEARLWEAVRAGQDARAFDRLEAALLAREAFPPLASLYRERAAAAHRLAQRVELLARLAELLEAELSDPDGAAAVYGQMAAEGDEAALEEQLRLLRARGDRTGTWRALDLAVERARAREARCHALTRRGQAALEAGELAAARADFAAVLSLEPAHLDALTGLSQLLPVDEPPAPLLALEAAVALASAGPSRDARYRELARLADARPDCMALSLRTWRALAASQPLDAEATERLTALLSGPGNETELVAVLHARIARTPRGEAARALRFELVRALDALGCGEDAVEALRDAVRAEPGNHEAWLLLADRAEAGARHAEYAWALEHAATSTVDPAARAQLWRRLGAFLERVPGKHEEARACMDRAARLERAVRVGATALGPLVQPPRPKAGGVTEPPPAHADTDVARPPEDRIPTAPRPPPPAPPSVLVDLTPAAVPPAPAIFPARPLLPVGPEPTPVRPLPGRGWAEATAVSPPATLPEVTPVRPPVLPVGPEPTPVRPLPGRGWAEATAVSPPATLPEVTPVQPRVSPVRPSVQGRRGGPSPSPVEGDLGPPGAVPGGRSTAQRRRREAGEGWGPTGAAARRPSPADALGEEGEGGAPAVPPERRDTWPGGLQVEDGLSTDPGLTPLPAPPGDPPHESLPPTAPGLPPVLAPPAMARRGDRRPVAVPTQAPSPSQPLPVRLLEPAAWHAHAERCARAGDGWLATLSREVAWALEGIAGPSTEPPQWLLGEDERVQLLPEALSGPLARLLSRCGVALVAAAQDGPLPPPASPFSAGSGPGAPAALEALAAAVRVLGVRSPVPECMAQAGPPFALAAGAGESVRLQVGALAVQRPLPGGELRFFAGRALFTQQPLLRALRLLSPEQLEGLLAVLPEALRGGRRLPPEARALCAQLPDGARAGLGEGLEEALEELPGLDGLAMSARHAANRAGLVACGSVRAAVLALRAKRAQEEEVEALLRFAASDRWRSLSAAWAPVSAPPGDGR